MSTDNQSFRLSESNTTSQKHTVNYWNVIKGRTDVSTSSVSAKYATARLQNLKKMNRTARWGDQLFPLFTSYYTNGLVSHAACAKSPRNAHIFVEIRDGNICRTHKNEAKS